MKTNKIVISFNKPVHEVFAFTVTPPNSVYWIPGIIKEETNALPIKIGTIYKLQNKAGESFELTVTDFKENKMIVWIATDQNYHCRYTYTRIDDNSTKLEYYEWVDKGELSDPFTQAILNKLKTVVEAS